MESKVAEEATVIAAEGQMQMSFSSQRAFSLPRES